ncbi:hypothetical protein AVEN_158090-1 [Araneus ventricosus]|uniref:MATH domain-containing protein n=1 Tax=Araneus ventricosus TaxID=182803 RepID=A0A4Y2HSY8_ARAVE|nr:hypothetical protein AVEN_158090-1 [Araneus ventricosus]
MAENRGKYLKFIWKVENFSFIWNKTDDFLKSETFYLDIFEGSAWCLKLYPRGRSSYENYVSVFLERLSSCEGPFEITIDFEIGLLKPNGATDYMNEMKGRCFKTGDTHGFNNLVARERMLGARKSVLLPEDVLSLQCCIFPKDAELRTYTEVIAKTHTRIERYH